MQEFIKNNKSIIFRVILILVLIFVVYFFINYSFARITVSSSDDKTPRLFTTSDSTPVFNKDIQPNKSSTILIKKGTKLITIRGNDTESRAPFSFKPFYSGSYKVDLRPQVKVEKVASNSLACGLSNKSSVFNSYRCQGGSDIVRYNTSGDFPENTVFLDRLQTQLVKPQQYLGGVLAFTYINPESNAFRLTEISVEDSLVENNIKIDKFIKTDLIEKVNLNTDLTNKKNKSFVIVDNDKNKLFIFKSTSDKQPAEVNLQDGIDKDQIATHDCSVTEGKIACIYSRFSETIDDNPIDEDLDKNTKDVKKSMDTVLTIYDQTGKKLTRRVIKEVGKVNKMLIKGDYIAIVTDQNNLVLYRVSGSKFSRVGESSGVEDVIFTEDDGLVVREDSRLYSVSPDTLESNLIFSSKNLRFSRFSSSYDSGYFAGFINNQKNANLSSYQITNVAQKGERVIDHLPSSYSKLISQADYNNSTLYIKLALKSFTSDRQTGITTIDQTELNTAKNEVLSQMKKSGTTKYFNKIIFSY